MLALSVFPNNLALKFKELKLFVFAISTSLLQVTETKKIF